MSVRHGFVLSAPRSGSGKTTVSLAVMAALVKRGRVVSPFKCGPDFIDPGYHRMVTGVPSINLDGWMCGGEFVRDTFYHHAAPHGVAVIEGAMGLFDGIGSATMSGSSAQIAALTGAPVVLVVNARGMAASAAALVSGFSGFDPAVRIAGVIFNNVGSESHATLLRETLALHTPDTVCFGCIPRDEALSIPSRHLGLVTAEDNPLPAAFIDRLASIAERCIDLDALCSLSITGGATGRVPVGQSGGNEMMTDVTIAVARDEAFCFIYEDNIRLLQEQGASIVFFSPLHDGTLPRDTSGIYLPGGYPELYRDALAANSSMKEAIRRAIESDMPVYAECGGFVYLTEGIDDAEAGKTADFTGIYPVRCRMLTRRKALGYRQVELLSDSPVGGEGDSMRGHEFHYSEAGEMPPGVERCYHVSRQGVSLGAEGYRIRNCLASYIHLHFGSNHEAAAALAAACRAWSGSHSL